MNGKTEANALQVIVRLAREDDLPRLNAIYNWAVENTAATFDLERRGPKQALDWFASHQDEFYPLFVLAAGSDIAGWGSLSPFHTRPAYRLSGEFSLYLAPEFQGRGLGHVLLCHLCDEAGRLGYHTLLGLISGSNTASLALAGKHGFREVGRYSEVGWKFGCWQDVVVVQRLWASAK
ncbi:Gcn5-related N-acetyltransferase (GNAT) domain protein [Acididesulfobacillus acetoxydans]|uniref:Gcn5-related N-acetyltransferase (GNAT) domain protein n=1 Tax=Acididesulfobacillus acetoxydans TaxID=1561005 RepID=A0A8S0Y2U0_9FIRM|nr:GNAT family N-acetyltransferase [Acididesulfobacillus acetoxydans]CAA7601185.1 Gcn5-related N-acetyltransferase (GNAT) domain protein [Acididesulfobacillus acetoxydans]CEJ08536.1 Sortase-like acyltransferase [Acididesulfobacillus acetoxydans]